MEFIDHTGHIFSLKSYTEYPVGYEYETNDYIFWLDDEYTGNLSTNNFYVKAVRPLLVNSTLSKQCCSSDISYPEPQTIQYNNPNDGHTYDYTIEHELKLKSPKREIEKIHISVDSKYYTLLASSQIQDLLSSNKKLSDYIKLDSQTDLKKFLCTKDINVVDDLIDYTYPVHIENGEEIKDFNTPIERQFCMIPFYFCANCDEEGTWLTNVLIHVEYTDGDNEWCPITVGGVFHNESEELVINGKNMGITLPKDIIKAVYQSSFYNDVENETLYNDKLKELLLSYMHIKMEAGNFQSAIDSLKWFGYGNHITIFKLLQTDNQFLNQYLLDNFDTSVDLLHSFNTFRNSTLVSLQIPDNVELDELDPIAWNKEWFMGENKPYFEDLFKKIIEKRYDEGDIIFYKPYYNYIFDELGLKLACLQYYYEKYFLPIHLSIHSASITHRVFANDIKYIQAAEIKTANYPITNADPNITVKFQGEYEKYIYNHKMYVDSNYNSFNNTFELANDYSETAYYINDICVDIPICFMSKLDTQYYDCVLLLKKEGKLIYESHFNFWQTKYPVGYDKDGVEKFAIDNEYKAFVIVPKIINKNFNINYWLDKKYEICLGVNGNWYFYNFIIKLPEFQFNFGKLIYKYNVADDLVPYQIDQTNPEYVSPSEPYYFKDTTPGSKFDINTRVRLSSINLFRQINKITDTGVDFNSFMYVPSLVEVNDINFVSNLQTRIQKTDDELKNAMNKWHENQIQISDLKFPLEEGAVYAYNDVINAYYRLSVEETSTIKNLTVKYRGFLNWHNYVEYMKMIETLDVNDANYKEQLDELNKNNGVIFDCEVVYDFINNTITARYPEYNRANLEDWFGVNDNDEIDYTGIGERKIFNWYYKSNIETIVDEFNNEHIVETIIDDENKYENLNYIKIENGEPIHYKITKYVTTNAVYNYIKSNDTFGTFDLSLIGEIGNTIVANSYVGLAVHLIGELENGYRFEKLKYAEPPIREVGNEEHGDYCPFSEKCAGKCGHNCKYAKPIQSDRPKDDDGHYILTDTFNRSIDRLEPIGKPDNKQLYSDIVAKSISSLISKYKESPIIVENEKYLNRIHMYHLYDENGNMLEYYDDSTYPDIIRGEFNCDKKNSVYMNHVKGNSLVRNTEYFYQDLYKQPKDMIDFYLQFFEQNGNAKLVYPADSYFDFDTYLMHDEVKWEKMNYAQVKKYSGKIYVDKNGHYEEISKDKCINGESYWKCTPGYWYIVFISVMTIDCKLTDNDLVAKKNIDYKAFVETIENIAETNETNTYIQLSSGLYVNKATKYLHSSPNVNALVKLEDLINNDITNVSINSDISTDAQIKQVEKIVNNYQIIDRENDTYLSDNLLAKYSLIHTVDKNIDIYSIGDYLPIDITIDWWYANNESYIENVMQFIRKYSVPYTYYEQNKVMKCSLPAELHDKTVNELLPILITIKEIHESNSTRNNFISTLSQSINDIENWKPNAVKRYSVSLERAGEHEIIVVKQDISIKNNNWVTLNTFNVETNSLISHDKLVEIAKNNAIAYIKRWKNDLKSEAESYIQTLVDIESSRYKIIESIDQERHCSIFTLYKDDVNVYNDQPINWFDTENQAKQVRDSLIAGFRAKFEIVNDSYKVHEYIWYLNNAPIYKDNKFRVPELAPNFGEPLTINYKLKWKRSSNQFLINRMYFADTNGINQFNNDDIIVASIDNVNFPIIFDNGSKWKFDPISLGTLDSAHVESSTNSAIVSIGKGNKRYNRGYYDVNVRYSIDAFNQHQYMKTARILVK